MTLEISQLMLQNFITILTHITILILFKRLEGFLNSNNITILNWMGMLYYGMIPLEAETG